MRGGRWPDLRRRAQPPPLLVDAALGLLFTVVGALEPAMRTVDGFDDGPLWLSTAIGACLGMLLVLRRQAPAVCLVAMCAVLGLPSLVVPHGDYFWSQLLPLSLAVYPAARLLDGPLGRWGWVLAVAAIEADLVHSEPARSSGGPALPLVVFGGCAVAGRLARRSAGEAAELAHTLARVAEEQAAREEAAVEAERTRIAVEVQDVVAHAVSVMVLQVGAARVGLEQRQAAVPEQLRAAEHTGREALGELRHSLGVLREEPDKGSLHPLPGVADLDPLVERFRGAGLDLRADLTGLNDLADLLPVGLQLSLYRLLQEALTNVLKHAGPVPVVASVSREGDEVLVMVENRDGGADPAAGLPLGGHGLLGMKERAAMYGGRLRAERLDDGFVVEARLPVPVTARQAADAVGAGPGVPS